MNVLTRLLVLGSLLVGFATGCSTPGTRAHLHPAAFQQLSSADQKLVLHGHVRPGLSQEGVYIAWGEPDAKTSPGGDKQDSGTETWIYLQRVTLWEAMSSYDHFGPYHGYGDQPAERWLRPGYGIGGIGNEGLLQYQPNVRSLDTLRIAVFNTGKVDRYKTADGEWVRPARPAASAVASPHPARHESPPPSSEVRTKPTPTHGKNSVALRHSNHSPRHRHALTSNRHSHPAPIQDAKSVKKVKAHDHAGSAIHTSAKSQKKAQAGHSSGKNQKRMKQGSGAHHGGYSQGKSTLTAHGRTT